MRLQLNESLAVVVAAISTYKRGNGGASQLAVFLEAAF